MNTRALKIGLTLMMTSAVLLFGSDASAQDAIPEATQQLLDWLWVLIAAALVFFMQAGFLCLEVGLVRERSIQHVAIKNLIDWFMVSVVYFVVGFAFMFGRTRGGLLGADLFGLSGLETSDGSHLTWTFFLFQLGFASTAVTIVSGALNERVAMVPYLIAAAVLAGFIYPVFGHWAWGGLYFQSNSTWLADAGFLDFAGSTVVHSVGGWTALVGIWLLGPRLGRYGRNGEVLPIQSYNFPLAFLGVIILWLGWWGFNGGSTLAATHDVGKIIFNTNVAGAAAGLSALVHSITFQGRADLYEKAGGGALGGLVAITACCDVVSPLGAVCVGGLAGLVHNFSYDLIIKALKLDDPVGAVPVHLACGIFGTLCVAMFGAETAFPDGNTRLEQLGVQALGIATCGVFVVFTSSAVFTLLKASFGLRVAPNHEISGIDLAGDTELAVPVHHAVAPPPVPRIESPAEADYAMMHDPYAMPRAASGEGE